MIFTNRTEELTEGASADRVHGSGLQVDEDGTGNVLATSGLIVVNVNALQLEVRVTVVCTGGVDTVLKSNNIKSVSNSVAKSASTYSRPMLQDDAGITGTEIA